MQPGAAPIREMLTFLKWHRAGLALILTQAFCGRASHVQSPTGPLQECTCEDQVDVRDKHMTFDDELDGTPVNHLDMRWGDYIDKEGKPRVGWHSHDPTTGNAQ